MLIKVYVYTKVCITYSNFCYKLRYCIYSLSKKVSYLFLNIFTLVEFFGSRATPVDTGQTHVTSCPTAEKPERNL